MPFLPPNQQRQSTEGMVKENKQMLKEAFISHLFYFTSDVRTA